MFRPARDLCGPAQRHGARRPFKRWLAQFVPAALERSTYVLCSSLALALLFWQWRPMPELMWRVGEPTIAIAVKGVAVFGWVVVRAMFTIKHFELFGLHPAGRSMAGDCFRSPLLGGFARHPILSRLHRRVLGDAHDDRRAHAVRGHDDGRTHHGRHAV